MPGIHKTDWADVEAQLENEITGRDVFGRYILKGVDEPLLDEDLLRYAMMHSDDWDLSGFQHMLEAHM